MGKDRDLNVPAPEHYLAKVRASKPDLVLLSGDVLFQGNRKGGLEPGILWLKALQAALAASHGDAPADAPQRLYVVGGTRSGGTCCFGSRS